MRPFKLGLAVLLVLCVPAVGLAQGTVGEEAVPEAWEYFLGTWISEPIEGFTYRFEITVTYNSYNQPDVKVNWRRLDPVLTLTLATGTLIVFDRNDDTAQYATGWLSKNNAVGFPYDAYATFSRIEGSSTSKDDKLSATLFQYITQDPPFEGNRWQVMTLTRLVQNELED